MAEKVVMPKFGMSMEEGTVVEWLKDKDEPVEKGEPIVTISSDKITNELEAPAKGVLIEVLAGVDDTIKVGRTLAYIGEQGETVNTESDSGTASQTKSAPETAVPNSNSIQKKNKPSAAGGRIKISPAAKKLAKANDVDYETLKGTGPQGRITKQDVEQHVENGSTLEEPEQKQLSPETENASTVTSVKGMRKVIAERMHESLQKSAQLTLMKKANVTELLKLQKQAKQEMQERDTEFPLTVTAFIAKAVVNALKVHPSINSAYIKGEIHTFKHIHLGLAASLENGLVVPVLFHAQKKSVLDFAETIHSLSKKARDNQLSNDEMKGSTFTITNLGSAGVEYFTPILNPPEAGILGTGSFKEELVIEDGEVRARQFLPLSLTFDHRVLDGDPASRFLNEVVNQLEHPYYMLL
ncbi:dihydrolipoamide acetyltransferase family protein [Alteribacillus sp. HJP-4]|uniref:dihydrolipoamide acetyltransferase family protein n=1 Tax=Alteribacillus sp. HJP-4 TaxID=2775394 RepID=UPI0035CCCB65